MQSWQAPWQQAACHFPAKSSLTSKGVPLSPHMGQLLGSASASGSICGCSNDLNVSMV
eukprot:CAMPEP_0206523660 /NCGR_PEP_ID=MMETSP0324_2-20121206/67741_1 /ASSEMBLY_ACC=CAM_ASM_000836 /TAXON_ID=2866 /ORGANISM="Crypthecodinium cohnii, Strain Seligo" /LENGTH=57 /DNA_ID=CAMNT_0054018119 /DNA_START=555 /DNA_END=725 /DNA_ORIENTATION=-